MKNTIILIIAVLSLLTLSSCGKGIRPDSSSLINTHWKLISINGITVTLKKKVTLRFDEKKASGFSGCNRYFSKYNINKSSVHFHSIGSTKMLCGNQNTMRIESQLLKNLSAATSFYVNNKKQLLIKSSSGSLLFERSN